MTGHKQVMTQYLLTSRLHVFNVYGSSAITSWSAQGL